MKIWKQMGSFIGAIPILAVIIAPKSAVIFLLCVLILILLNFHLIGNKITVPTKSYYWLGALTFCAMMALMWAQIEPGSGLAFLKFITVVVVGFVTLLALSQHRIEGHQHIEKGVVLGFILGVGVVGFATIFALLTNSSLWGSYYFDPLTTLNNSAVVISLSSWIAFIVAGKYSVRHAVLVLVLTLALLLILTSLAATCAFLIGGLVLLTRRISGRRGGIFIAFVTAILIVSAPYVVKFSGAKTYATPEAQTAVSSLPPSTRHRLAMWSFAVEKIDEKPWLGWGFGSSRHIPQEDRRLAPNMEIMPLHPHNLALQTRLELGLPGSLILAGLVFSVFYRLATFTNDGWISGLAMAPAAGWLFVANVSYGMWQSWWIALAFLLAVFMKFALAGRGLHEN